MNTCPVCLLGAGALLTQGGRPVTPRSRKQLALLVYLISEHQTVHSRNTLLTLLWPDESQESAQNNLRFTLSSLRGLGEKIAPADLANNPLLHSDRYTVQISPSWVMCADVNRFQQRLETTRQHNHSNISQCKSCQATLLQAVQLYQGEFLEGFCLDDCPAFEEWLFIQRERLHVRVSQAYSDLAAYAEMTGDLAGARGFVQRQIELDPLREPAYRQQMRILTLLGERSAALSVFERCRSILNQELGLDPEPETLALHMQILNAEMSPITTEASQPVAGRPTAHQTKPTHPSPGNNLTQPLTPLIGREEELEQLSVRLQTQTYRLITVAGPGGMGKSRLAQQIALQHLFTFENGVYFVPLTQIQSIDLIPAAIISAMGLAFNESAKTPKEQLLDKLRSQALLLILDNFEHLIAGRELLLDILQSAPRIVLLVTSRERLNLQAEDLFQLQGLPVPTSANDPAANSYTAIRLFTDRAHRLDKHFRLSAEELPHVVRICQLVDGLPLGIELAAAWVQEFGIAEIAAKVAQSPGVLETAFHDLRPQHRSLRHVFDYSWSLLLLEEQAVLARLAIFRGGFSTVAAQTVAGASRLVITHLCYKSLLVSKGAGLYDMHEIVRQFSFEKLETLKTPTGESARSQTEENHANYYLNDLHQHEQLLFGATPRLTVSQIQPSLDNIRQAWQWAVAHSAWELVENALVALSRFYEFSGLFAEAIANYFHADLQLAHQIEQASKAESDRSALDRLRRVRLRMMVELVDHMHSQGRYQETETILSQVIQLSELIDDQYGRMRATLLLANNRLVQGKNDQAFELFSNARALAQAGNFPLYEGLTLRGLGNIWRQRGDFTAFEDCLQQALKIQRSIGHLAEVYTLLTWLGGYRQLKRDVWGGRQLLKEALSLNDAVATPYHEAILRSSLARNDAFLGRFDTARVQIRQLINAHQQNDDMWHLISNKLIEMYIDYSTDNPQRAIQTAEAILLQVDEQTYGEHAASLYTILGYANSEANQVTNAQNAFQLALDRWQRINNRVRTIEAQAGLASVALALGNAEEARCRVEPILDYLGNHELHAAIEPYRVYWALYQILLTHGDPRAQPLLQRAYTNLQNQANLIPDLDTRRSFLENIPAHRRIYRKIAPLL